MPVKIFFCYAHEDETLLNKLKTHLRPLQRKGLIDVWYDRDIRAGTKWEEEIDKHLNEANIILLLVSPDFMDSDYCYGKEMHRALERDQRGEARVIPIILRSVYWQGVLETLQALPTDARPVVDRYWHNLDEAFFDVAEGIRKTIISLKTKMDWLDEGISFHNLNRYNKALEAFEEALRLDQNYIEAYQEKGITLLKLEHWDDALVTFEQALHLNPKLVPLYIAKGQTLDALARYEEALTAFEQAIHLDPTLADAYIGRDKALQHLGVSRKAQEQLEIQLQEARQQIVDHQKRTEELENLLEQTRQQRDEALGQLGLSREIQRDVENQLKQTQQQLVDQEKQAKQLEGELQQLTNQQKRVEQLEGHLEQIQRQKDKALQQLDIAKEAQEKLLSQLEQVEQRLATQQKLVEQLEDELRERPQQAQSVTNVSTDSKACPSCGSLNPTYETFCSNCGAMLEDELRERPQQAQSVANASTDSKACPSCGSLNPTYETFCSNCGAMLTILHEKKEKIIYLGPEEEFTNVRERLENTDARSIILVIPPQTQLRSHVGWRLLRSRARELGQDVLVISSDRQIRTVVRAAGFRVAQATESPTS